MPASRIHSLFVERVSENGCLTILSSKLQVTTSITSSQCYSQHQPMEHESSMKAAVDTAVEHQVLYEHQMFILHNL